MKAKNADKKHPVRLVRTAFAALCCAAIACGMLAAPAGATVIHHDHHDGPLEFLHEGAHNWSVTGSPHVDFVFEFFHDSLEARHGEHEDEFWTNNWYTAENPNFGLISPMTMGQHWGPGSPQTGDGTGYFFSDDIHPIPFDMQNYVGFVFALDGNHANLRYGWALVTVNAEHLIIHEWAYESTGAGIVVGQLHAVPEPSAAALVLCAGLPAFVFMRRRRGRPMKARA